MYLFIFIIFFQFDFKELTIIIIASITLTLMFEIPFQNIRTVLLNKPTSNIHNKKPLSARL